MITQKEGARHALEAVAGAAARATADADASAGAGRDTSEFAGIHQHIGAACAIFASGQNDASLELHGHSTLAVALARALAAILAYDSAHDTGAVRALTDLLSDEITAGTPAGSTTDFFGRMSR